MAAPPDAVPDVSTAPLLASATASASAAPTISAIAMYVNMRRFWLIAHLQLPPSAQPTPPAPSRPTDRH